ILITTRPACLPRFFARFTTRRENCRPIRNPAGTELARTTVAVWPDGMSSKSTPSHRLPGTVCTVAFTGFAGGGKGMSTVHIDGPPTQTPAWHVLVSVQAFPSSHGVPAPAGGFEHVPVAGLHVPLL